MSDNFKGIQTFEMDKLRNSIQYRNSKKDEVAGNIGETQWIDGKFSIGGVVVDEVTPTAIKQILSAVDYDNYDVIDMFKENLTPAERYAQKVEGVDLNRMFRVLNIPQKDGSEKARLYGAVSDRYKIMDNDVIMDIIDGFDGELLPVIGTKMTLDHTKMRFVPENMRKFNVGDHLPMVEVINSESGMGALSVWAGVYTIKCTNGLMTVGNYEKTRMVHLGSNYTVPTLGNVFNKAVETVDVLYRAETQYMTTQAKSNVIDFIKDKNLLSEPDINSAIEFANKNYRGGQSLADVIGAFTHSAQRFAGRDMELSRRTKVETVAGALLERFAA